jgi:flagellar assembly protein FliH
LSVKATKFLFGTDFRQPVQETRQADPAAEAKAEARGYARGIADGLRQAEVEAQTRLAESQARLASVLDRVAEAAGTLLASVDAHHAETEELALSFATALARKLAGEALAREPLAAIAAAAAQTFQHLRGVPHLAVRVNDSLVEEVDRLIRAMARERGFEGRVVTLGDPDMAAGDVRLEWADGGLFRDNAGIEAAVAQALRHTS